MEKQIDWTLVACIAGTGIVIFLLGRYLLQGSSWSNSEGLVLLASVIEGALSATIGVAIRKFLFRRKNSD
jgi:hypothetical protein